MAISVPVAIILGLVASFVQSLGLTIQRKSHLQNETLPTPQRRSEWRRKLWLVGFAIFISANIGGTVFQIGALPIVMLAPLGAVSLLFNALLATFILDDFLSSHMVGGTLLIAAGAVLIGYFGVVQENPHSLDELLALYARPAFIAFASCFALAFFGVLLVAHLTEWGLNARLARAGQASHKRRRRKKSGNRLQRRWSAPTLAPVAEVSESASGIATPVIAVVEEAARRGVVVGSLANADERRHLLLSSGRKTQKKDYGALNGSTRHQRNASDVEATPSADTAAQDKATSRPRLGLAVAYGGASGTLSGVCLLLAKSGIELLVLTFSGHNQFARWQSWALVLVMLAAALLQLWYLNKSLKLVDPTLVCPLAFCFYNTSSIMLGLVYFNQLGALPALNILAVVLGTAVLLAGVWLVSMHGHSGSKEDLLEPEEPDEAEAADEATGLLANAAGIAGPHLPPVTGSADATPPTSPTQTRVARSRSGSLRGGLGLVVPCSPDGTCEEFDTSTSTTTSSVEEEPTRRTIYSTLLERGLQIGISVSSPGFHIPTSAGTVQSPRRPPNSPSDTRRARRALSEGDALVAEMAREVVVEEAGARETTSAAVVLEEEDASAAVDAQPADPASSAWGSVIRGVDTAALTARLARLDPRRRNAAAPAEAQRQGGTGWWSWGRRIDQA